MKKIGNAISIFLAIVLMMSSVYMGQPVYASIAFEGGDGSSANPYQIATAEQLNAVRYQMDKNYILMNDIDLSSYANWEPIGIRTMGMDAIIDPFTGTFNGDGNIITGLTINRSSETYVGLFGYVENATIENLGIESASVSGYGAVGTLIGWGYNITVTNTYATGTVTGTNTAAGGLMGGVQESSVSNSYAACTVSGRNQVGGLIGAATSTNVTDSYATSAVTGQSYIGGLIGDNVNSNVTDTYATGSVTGVSKVGGLMGRAAGGAAIVTYSYAAGAVTGNDNVGGLIGFIDTNPTVTSCFWDTDTSGQDTSAGGIGAIGTTTELMKQESTFTDWDFENKWAIESGTTVTYPYLINNTQDPVPGLEAAPTLTAGAVTRTSCTEGTVKFTSSKAGSYYYVVVADGADVPSIDTSGSGIECTTSEITITNPVGLTAGDKDIYIQVKDAAGLMSEPLKIDIVAAQVSNWTALKDAINNATTSGAMTTIEITESFTKGNTTIEIIPGKNITIQSTVGGPYTITQMAGVTEATNETSTFFRLNQGTLTLKSIVLDGANIPDVASAIEIGGIAGYDNGTFIMDSGAVIRNVKANDGSVRAAAVSNLNGTAIMKAGSLITNCENIAGNNTGVGGVINLETFIMEGGSVTNCKGQAGVYNRAGTITLSGEVNISGNTLLATGAASNLRLLPDQIITIAPDGLLPDSNIGVYRYINTGDAVAITNANSEDYSEYFFSDIESLTINNIGTGDNQVLKLMSNNANLSSLSLSSGTLSPDFSSGTTSYTASVGNEVGSITVTPTVAISNATVKVDDVAVTSGTSSGAINLDVGTNTVQVDVTAQDGTTKTYSVIITRSAPQYSAIVTVKKDGSEWLINTPDIKLSTNSTTLVGAISGTLLNGVYTFEDLANGSTYYVWEDSTTDTYTGQSVTLAENTATVNYYTLYYNGNGSTSGNMSPKVLTIGTVFNLDENLFTKTGYTFSGWNTESNGSGTDYADEASFTMPVGGDTLYARWTRISSGGGSPPSTQPQQDTGNSLVTVNGESTSAGTEVKITKDGKSINMVQINNEVVNNKIKEAMEDNTTSDVNTIQISSSDKDSEAVSFELTGDIVKKLDENDFEVSVKNNNIEYIIPAKEFTISKVAEALNVSEKDLQEIKVEVRITKPDEEIVEKYNQMLKDNDSELIFPPVSFEVVANTTRKDGSTDEVVITKFSNYVERVMEIPAGVDPSKITTGVVFNPDGTCSHVPTSTYQKDGKWYARINSLTNSTYSVIWNPITVKSVENHWSKETVNDMASRLIVFNAETFMPDKAITRAEYSEYIVRALGLYREGSKHENKFMDVDANRDRTLAILIANEYGIVTGYPDGTFRPEALITREEAMTMYQRAMKVTKLVGTDPNRYQNYTDYNQVSSWATSYVKEVLSAHVFNGNTATTLSPKSNLTYAEAIQAVKNLLVESKLINKK